MDSIMYIYTPQGKFARLDFDHSDKRIEGLATDGFSCCAIVSLIGVSRCSLGHLDFSNGTFEQLSKEIEWVQPVRAELCFRSSKLYFLEKDLQNIDEMLNGIPCERRSCDNQQTPYGVKLSQNGISTYQRNSELEFMTHPEWYSANLCYNVTANLCYKVTDDLPETKLPRAQRLLFDGTKWEALQYNDLEIAEHLKPFPEEELTILFWGQYSPHKMLLLHLQYEIAKYALANVPEEDPSATSVILARAFCIKTLAHRDTFLIDLMKILTLTFQAYIKQAAEYFKYPTENFEKEVLKILELQNLSQLFSDVAGEPTFYHVEEVAEYILLNTNMDPVNELEIPHQFHGDIKKIVNSLSIVSQTVKAIRAGMTFQIEDTATTEALPAPSP
jgi:hypothetical protein